MSVATIAVFVVLAFSSAFAAQRIARDRGRKPMLWAVAAISLGPLPLVPLALLPKRSAT